MAGGISFLHFYVISQIQKKKMRMARSGLDLMLSILKRDKRRGRGNRTGSDHLLTQVYLSFCAFI